MGYQVDGRLLEVCTCNVLCPCWVGSDPDGGTCDSVIAWHVDSGSVNGVDVSNHTVAAIVHIPGNVLQGNWKALLVLDDRVSDAQLDALVGVFSGKLGGPIADLAALIGEVVGVEKMPISFEVVNGEGHVKIGSTLEAELEPLRGADGSATSLHDSVFSTIPGSPAYVGRSLSFRRETEQYGLKNLNIQGRNAIQGSFHFEA